MNKYIVLVLLLFSQRLFAQESDLDSASSSTDITKLSLEDLLNREVKAGSLTRLKRQNAPASITTITAEDIANTPARSIYDLMEVFVPGAIWASHYEGAHVGIRSAPTDRNYKYLLLVDGVNLNQKSHNGMSSELDNWDIDDIEKIEIIRGPGSVTFGPGATMGVVNIVTKKAKKENSLDAAVRILMPYNAKGANLSYAVAKEKFKLYTFASIIDLPGYENADMFRVERNEDTKQFQYGYIGKEVQMINGIPVGNAPPLNYMCSETPQMKLHLGVTLFKEWDLLVRYTSSSLIGQYSYPQLCTIRDVDVTSSEIDKLGVHRTGTVKYGNYSNYGYAAHRVFSSAVRNVHQFSPSIELSTKLSWYSHDFELGWNDYYLKNISSFDSVYKYFQLGSLTSPNNKLAELGRNWSENEFVVNQILNWKPTSRVKLAFGGEISRTSIQKGWGDSKNEFIAGENWDFISDENSYYVRRNGNNLNNNSKSLSDFTLVGNGFGVTTYSLFAEANMQLNSWLMLLASGRVDKNSYIKWLTSPRFALIAELTPSHTLKLLAQRSQRMNTLNQLYLEKVSGTESDNESLTSLEMIYSYSPTKQLSFGLPAFYNIVDNIGVERSSSGAISTVLLGRYRCWGLEPEIRYVGGKVSFGCNHSFYVPLSWQLYENAGGVNLSSVGDWNTNLGGLHLTSQTANSLCWSNQTSKLWVNVALGKKLHLHLDARMYWDFEGGKDMLSMWKTAAQGTSSEQEISTLVDELNKRKLFGSDFRLNAGISYKLLPSTTFTLSGMNLLSVTDNKRYSLWEFWNQYPNFTYTKEPLCIMIKLHVHL